MTINQTSSPTIQPITKLAAQPFNQNQIEFDTTIRSKISQTTRTVATFYYKLTTSAIPRTG